MKIRKVVICGLCATSIAGCGSSGPSGAQLQRSVASAINTVQRKTGPLFNNSFSNPLSAKDKKTLAGFASVGNRAAESLLKLAGQEPAGSRVSRALHTLASDYEALSQDLASCQTADQASTSDSCVSSASSAALSAAHTAEVTDSRVLGLGAPRPGIVDSDAFAESTVSVRSAFSALVAAGSKANIQEVRALGSASKAAAQAAVQLAAVAASDHQALANSLAQQYQRLAADATEIEAATTEAQGVAGFKALSTDYLHLQTLIGQADQSLPDQSLGG